MQASHAGAGARRARRAGCARGRPAVRADRLGRPTTPPNSCASTWRSPRLPSARTSMTRTRSCAPPRAIGRRELVAPLHLLTVADSLATGPGAWGPWHDALVGTLVSRLDAALDPAHATSGSRRSAPRRFASARRRTCLDDGRRASARVRRARQPALPRGTLPARRSCATPARRRAGRRTERRGRGDSRSGSARWRARARSRSPRSTVPSSWPVSPVRSPWRAWTSSRPTRSRLART